MTTDRKALEAELAELEALNKRGPEWSRLTKRSYRIGEIRAALAAEPVADAPVPALRWQTARVDFERHYRHGFDLTRSDWGDGYKHDGVDAMWKGWLACALAAAPPPPVADKGESDRPKWVGDLIDEISPSKTENDALAEWIEARWKSVRPDDVARGSIVSCRNVLGEAIEDIRKLAAALRRSAEPDTSDILAEMLDNANSRIAELGRELAAAREALIQLVDEKCDYMQHTVKAARRAFANTPAPETPQEEAPDA